MVTLAQCYSVTSYSLDLFDLRIWLTRPRADYSSCEVLCKRQYTTQSRKQYVYTCRRAKGNRRRRAKGNMRRRAKRNTCRRAKDNRRRRAKGSARRRAKDNTRRRAKRLVRRADKFPKSLLPKGLTGSNDFFNYISEGGSCTHLLWGIVSSRSRTHYCKRCL